MLLIIDNASGLVGGLGAAAREAKVGMFQGRSQGPGPGPGLGIGPGLRGSLAALREDRKTPRKALHHENS